MDGVGWGGHLFVQPLVTPGNGVFFSIWEVEEGDGERDGEDERERKSGDLLEGEGTERNRLKKEEKRLELKREGGM